MKIKNGLLPREVDGASNQSRVSLMPLYFPAPVSGWENFLNDTGYKNNYQKEIITRRRKAATLF
jgi:hypothetical protein